MAEFGPFLPAVIRPGCLPCLFTSGAVAHMSLDLAFVQVAAQLLRQAVLTAGGFLFARNACLRFVGGVCTGPSRFSSFSHDQHLQKERIACPWWATAPAPSTVTPQPLHPHKPYGIVRPLHPRPP